MEELPLPSGEITNIYMLSTEIENPVKIPTILSDELWCGKYVLPNETVHPFESFVFWRIPWCPQNSTSPFHLKLEAILLIVKSSCE